MEFKKLIPDFLSAGKHAREQRDAVAEGASEKPMHDYGEVPPDLFTYMFALQVAIEKEGPMSYHKYAERMWADLAGHAPAEHDEAFGDFESHLITGLHDINMRDHVYPEVIQSIAPLIEKYGSHLEHIAIWSTGDVEATGYQVGKIGSAHVVQEFLRGLRGSMPKEETRTFMKEKTSYMIEDDKFKRMKEYVGARVEPYRTRGEKMKLVIIEDSVKNFEKVKNGLTDGLGESVLEWVEIIPIWATYSREGQTAERDAEKTGSQAALEKKKQSLNAIASFTELLDEQRFGNLIDGAHVFVDFDGVIGNNVTMRQAQAKATYQALMHGMEHELGSEERVQEAIHGSLAKLASATKTKNV